MDALNEMVKDMTVKELQEEPVKHQLQIGEWTVDITLVDSLLSIDAHSLTKQNTLHKHFSQVPSQVSFYCENLEEVRNLLLETKLISIKQNKLVIMYSIGKKQKEVVLELESTDLSFEKQLMNNRKLLQIEKAKIIEAQNKMKQLEKQHEIKQKELQYKLQSTQSRLQQYRDNYTQCTKFRCRNLVYIKSGYLQARNGRPICSQACAY